MNKLFIVLLGVVLASQGVLAGEIGVIDNGRVMSEYPAAVDAQKKVINLKNELQSKVQKLQDDLNKELPKATDDKAKMALQQNAQSKFEAERVRFESTVQSITKQIDDSIQSALDNIAKSKNLSVVIPKSNVYYGGIDITDDVLRTLGASPSAKPSPKAPAKK